MITFDYRCDCCADKKNSSNMESFFCSCGGQFRLDKGFEVNPFQPFYSKQMKAWITSPKEEERLLRQHGYSYQSDWKKDVATAKQFRKYKEDMNKESCKRQGIKYEPNCNMILDEKSGALVDRVHRKYHSKRTYFVSLAILLFTSIAYAKIEGVNYTEINVNGTTYEVPLANKQYEIDLYWLKLALDGDGRAREMFLQGNDERWFFIGDEFPLWLHMTKNSVEVIKP